MLQPKIFRAMLTAVFLFCVTYAASVDARQCAELFSPVENLADYNAEFKRTPNDADNGLVTDRLAITPDTIVQAYAVGAFPWDVTPEGKGVWFRPAKRGVLDLNLDIGASDRKALRRLEAAIARGELRVSFDEAFEQVIRACSTMPRLRRNPKTGQLDTTGTWITEEIIQAYHGMFLLGKAHSAEIWKGDQLVAGIYGTLVHGVFTGESMFHTLPDVGKLALSKMAERLRSRGFQWMDTQVAPPDSSSLSVKWGAVEISREEHALRLVEARSKDLTWSSP